ncbi:MAG: dicarboxylate/amino acid:cation symporter [Phycisphaerales bacterium]|nr:dicarboxylate/amino acid:cation symporter [Phycisphaerales bacterium]
MGHHPDHAPSNHTTPPPNDRPKPPRRIALHWQIVAGLVVGAGGGLIAAKCFPPQSDATPHAGLFWFARNIAEPAGQIFLRLILMIVIPLVFSALVLGVVQIGDVRRLGRIGARTFLYTLVLSVLSVVIGLSLVNTVRPGERLPDEQRTALRERYAPAAAKTLSQARQAKSVRDTLLDLIPKNPLQEAVGAIDGSAPGGGMLAVMFFALIFGVAANLVGERARPLVAVLESVYEIVLVIVGFAMRLAPFGVAGLMFSLTATLGTEILEALIWYVMTVMSGLAFHLVVVYSIVLFVFARRNPMHFFGQAWEVIVTAFATSSSNATLPTALRAAEQDLGIRREIGGFVLTIGSTANQNGTALFEGVTVLFLAQVFGVDLNLTQQITVVLMSILAGVGTAGVPGGSLPLIVIVLQSVGIPGEGIGVILGVDRLLDMSRTVVNVIGDITIAACVDRAERRNGSPIPAA